MPLTPTPLTERDVNTQRDVPRNKRHFIQQDLGYTRLKNENSPATRAATGKATPPFQRLLAPTKSSAAKTSPSPRAAGSSTPQSTQESKLPRRTTPSTTPSTSRYGVRAAGRVTPSAKTPDIVSDMQSQEGDSSGNGYQPRVSRAAGRNSSATTKDKPLPARPVALLNITMSPTRTSRTLMDASEQPIHQSQNGSLEDWPAIQPHSAANKKHLKPDQNDVEKSHPRLAPDRMFSPDRWAPEVPSALVETTPSPPKDDSSNYASSIRSSSSTCLSADDNSTSQMTDTRAPKSSHGTNHSVESEKSVRAQSSPSAEYRTPSLSQSSSSSRHPARNASLQAQIDRAFSAASSTERACPLPGFTDLLRPEGQGEEGRPHSPSPASFSRPRPSSVSHGRSLPSPKTTVATAAKAIRAEKTASRLPIPDTKKATLVEVRSKSSNSVSRSENAPTFGSRRLDAPDTLKILDQGIKRRQLTQLRRKPTDSSLTSTISSTTKTIGLLKPSSKIERSGDSTPDDTCGTSSSDEEDITTPTWQPGFPTRSGTFEKPMDTDPTNFYHHSAVCLFDGAASALGKTPPRTSPFTVPLQTIPSQAALPLYGEDDVPSMPRHTRSPSDFASLNKRLSELHNAHADHTAGRIGARAPVPDSTKYSLMELLNEYAADDDDEQGTENHPPLNTEAKRHITRTLSLLEGKGDPPQHNVDNETLLHLFGHIKRGLESVPNPSLIDNAVAAELFIAQADNVHTTATDGGHPNQRTQSAYGNIGVRQSKPQLPPLQLSASKWSNSTESLHLLSAVSNDISPRQTNVSQKVATIDAPPQRPAPDPPRSIGYPSRIPPKATALIGPGESGASSPTDSLRRLSSPTLGKRKPGSVRTARETLHNVRGGLGGFARTTAAAESKKTAKMPTPNTKPLKMPEGSQRGRVATAETLRKQSESSSFQKAPRARSKSRFMLDKINGLFSGKRDKRVSALLQAPPVPAIAELEAPDRIVEISPNNSPVLSITNEVSPPAKKPTLSPPQAPALRKSSRTGIQAAPASPSPVDSVTEADKHLTLQKWITTLTQQAARESDPSKRERMLVFTKVVHDSLISAREAQLSAETAQAAAKRAQQSYELMQQSVALLSRLAGGMTGSPRR